MSLKERLRNIDGLSTYEDCAPPGLSASFELDQQSSASNLSADLRALAGVCVGFQNFREILRGPAHLKM